MRDLLNAGALDLIIATVDAGAPATQARSWWVAYLTEKANELEVELDALQITPTQVARVIALVADGKVNNKGARQVIDGVLAGEGEPDDVVAARGLGVVSDDSALQAEVDKALAANPDIADKIRAGKVQAAGKIVGDVMKATRGQADAARVRGVGARRLRFVGPAPPCCGQSIPPPPWLGIGIRTTRSSFGPGASVSLFTVRTTTCRRSPPRRRRDGRSGPARSATAPR